jgi:hypothetical protein
MELEDMQLDHINTRLTCALRRAACQALLHGVAGTTNLSAAYYGCNALI